MNDQTNSNGMSPQEKRALLEKLLMEKAHKTGGRQVEHSPPVSPSAPYTPIPVLDRDQKYFPLSSAQQRLWLLDQFEPGNPMYNISLLLRFKGRLDTEALERSLLEIGRRHEILRVNFTTLDGKPVQFLEDDRKLTLSTIDLTQEPGSDHYARAEQFADEDSQRSFDLLRDALARASLFRLADDDHLFQFIIHHIVFDGWSLNVFLQEFTFYYSTFSRKEEAVLPPLEIQYIDYASWDAEQMGNVVASGHLEYWREKLGGDLPVLDMPLDQPRPEIQSFRAGKETLRISPALTQKLHALSRGEGVTLFMTMLSVYYILLARYTAQEDIVVGTPIARRSRAEVEKLIGVFINNLALRTDLSGNITFRELLKRTRRTALDAFAHQDIPFERLLNELRIERDSSHSPVFQVFFNLLDVRKGVLLELPGIEVETPSLPEVGSIFDITLYVQNWGETLKLKLVYNADLFTATHMAEFLQRYHHLLEQITTNPDQNIFCLPLPGHARERQQQIIQNFSRLANGYEPFLREDLSRSITNRFECQVEKYPHRVAVKTLRHEWTYIELNRLANRAAHGILRNSTTVQDKVALLFDHEAPMVAGVLGALKAGKTYIPLDPHYPAQRLAFMLEDSQASLIVTNDALDGLAQKLAGNRLPLINIDRLNAEAPDTNPGILVSPDTLAYILYTSGSTGQPKGVMQNHRNVLHFIKAYTNNLHIGALDRLTLISSYSFDAAVMDIFGALLNGAALYPIDVKKEGLLNLAQYLRECEISVYHSTPTVYRYFLHLLAEADEFPNIRLVVLGGEAVVKRDVELYKKHFSRNCVFINGLGPTESTVSLQYFIDSHTEVFQNSVPVGLPVEETGVVLLNEAGQEAVLAGEIALHSPYVALGYWHKPEITEASFAARDGSRVYRTGDMGRLLPDGMLEFRGRKDFQVKIRGHRVEVGEVEARLAEHPSVRECVVTLSENGRGERHLLAYVVYHKSAPAVIELRNFLQEKLPDYMVPSIFVPIESLPLTPTGKIDRRALPQPKVEPSEAKARVSARNEIEEKLVSLWEEVLQVQPIGVRDNFFEVGGHSLLAVHLFACINREFNVNLPLATLFRDATIESLARVIAGKSNPETWSSLIEIESAGNHAPFFCVHGLTGDILWFRELAHCLAPHIPFYGLQSRGLDGIQAPFESIEEMAKYYIQEIRLLQPNGPYYLGGASFGGTVALEMAHQLMDQGEEVSILAVFDHSPANIQLDRETHKLQRRLISGYKMLRNFPGWLAEFVRLGPTHMSMRIRRKLKLMRKVGGQTDIGKLGELEADDMIDFASELEAHRQRLITSNFQALKKYLPKPYPGKVTLFRALKRPLLNTYDPEEGWQKLAPGRVTVYDISSSHEGMFKKPHVDDVAKSLKLCLDGWSTESKKP
jgi:amino acid adenylation domain-containing protein